MMMNGHTNGEHWLVTGLRGVNLLTLIVLIAGAAKLYFDLDKDIALINQKIDGIERSISSIQRKLEGRPSPYAWPPAGSKTRSSAKQS